MIPICPNAPPRVPLCLWRGDTLPIPEWLFGTEDEPADLTGSTFRLDVEWWPSRISLGSQAGSLTRVSPSVSLTHGDPAGGVLWPGWAADIALIPRGARARYALRRVINGTVETWAQGEITVNGLAGSATATAPAAFAGGNGWGTVDYSDLDSVTLDANGVVVSGTPLAMAAGTWTRVLRNLAPSPSNQNLPSGPWAGFSFWDGARLRARAVGDGYLIKFTFRVRPSQRDGAVRFAVRPNGNAAFDFGPDATVLTVDASQVEIGSRTFFTQVRPTFAAFGAEVYVFSSSGGDLLEFSPEVTPLFFKQ